MSDVNKSSTSLSTIKSNCSSKTIIQLITCPICLDIFREPLQLPCQHNFCKSCLERITVDRWSRCPVCRGCYRVPFAGVGSFEVNRTIINLLETHLCTESRPTLQAKCALCKLDDTITICEHCREAICYKCRREHYDEFRKYIILKLFETEQQTEKLILKEAETMKHHKDNIEQANEIANTIRNKVTELIGRIKEEEKKLLESVAEFHSAEQKLLSEKNDRLQELTKVKAFCFHSQSRLNSKEETDQEAVEIRHTCEDYVISVNELQNQILFAKAPRHRISFFNQDVSFDAITLGFMEVYTELEPIESSIQFSSLKRCSTDKSPSHLPKRLMHCLSNASHSQKDLSSSLKIDGSRSSSSPKHVKSILRIIGKRGTRDTEFIHPSSLAYSRRDRSIYVCDTYNNRLVTYGIDGSFQQVHKAISETGEKYFHYPYAIHIDANNRLYVIDQSERRIKVFNRDFKLIRVIGQYGQGAGQYLAPSDLCTNDKNQIFVCDAGGHRILKYSEQGEFLQCWGELGSDQGQLKCPACICTLASDRLAVSDWGNDRIQIFNFEGDHLLSIGHRGKLLAEFSRPLGLSYDETTERLFVCDAGNNRVVMFNHDFTSVELVTSKVNFNEPYDILVLKDGRRIITEYRAHRLQIV